MTRTLIALTALIIGILLYPTVRDIALICWTNEDYSHGLILPFVSGYLIWINRDKIFATWAQATRPTFSLSAAVLLLVGVLLLGAGAVTQILFISWFAVFPILLGYLALLLGWPGTAPLVAPILLLFMAKPIPDSLVPLLFFPLQVLAARVGAWTLEMLSVPVYLVGNIIEIPGMRLMVEEACSGIRSLMALLTVACIVMLVVPMKTWAKLLVVVVSVVTAIALNVFRVTLTGVLAHFYDPKSATGFFHEFSGLVVFALGLIIVYGVANLVSEKNLSINAPAKHPPISPFLSAQGANAGAVILLCSMLTGVFFQFRTANAQNATVEIQNFPIELDGWVGKEGEKLELTSQETLQLDRYVRRFYKREGDRSAYLYIGYWNRQSGEHQAAKHSPMMCLPANGWQVTKLPQLELTSSDGVKIPVSRVIGQYDQHYSLVYYFFFNGGEYYVREWEALIRIATSALLGRRTDGGIVEVSVEITAEEARELREGGELKGADLFLKDAVSALNQLIEKAELKSP